MGDIIQSFQVRAGRRGKGRPVKLYFDTGSPFTFMRESTASALGKPMLLPEPRPFGGLGNGHFAASAIIDLDIRFLGIWCACLAYVLPDDVMGTRYEMLVGHDLMQRLNIAAIPKTHRVKLNKASLELSLTVRCAAARPPQESP